MAVEFVGIELNLRGAKEVEEDLKEIDALLRSFNGRRKVDVGMDKLREDIVKARGELEKFQRKREKYLEAGGKGDAFSKEIKNARDRLKDLQQAQREVQTETRKMGRTFTQEMNSISSKVAHIGSAMQSMGNALVRLTSPFTRVTTGLLYGAGYKALNLITEGLGGAFERADTMKNYSRTLKEFGFNADEADKAVSKLEESVIGLPTGLDEIVAVQKRFVAASQDIEKSTDLAIAFNNAILASGSDARQQWTAQRILTQLAGGAEIATTSWQALQRAIPMVFTELAKESKMGVSEYVEALSKGKISTEEFMDAFTRIGSEGSIKNAALVLTKSWQGLSANITNRFRAMGQGIIETLHEVFKESTGRDLLDTLLGIDAEGNRTYDGIRDWIDGLSKSVQNWIKAHPEEIIQFFDTLKNIDWKGLLKGFAQGMGDMLGLLERFADFMSDKDLSKVGRFMVWANAIGNGLLVIGGAIKGSRGIIGFLGALGKFFGKGGLLGGLGGGKGGGMLGAGINGATFANVGKTGLLAAEITGIVGAISALATGFAALDMKFLSSAFKSFNEITTNLKVGLENISQIKASDIDMNGVKDLVKKVSEIYQTLSGIPMSVAVSKRMAKSTEKIRDTVFQLRRAAYQINQAAGTTVDSGGFATFVEQIRTSLDALRDLSGELMLDIEVKLSPLFGSSVNAVKTNIKNAKRDIEKMKTPISMYIPVTVTFSVTTNLLSALAKIRRDRQTIANANGGTRVYDSSISGGGHNANGGLIYRARGGGVGFPGRPIGTDRIPAWLTAGEYVHNKRAVSMFGIDFMRKVNSLDMKGAMNELMHRAGHMANINRGANITNNNYNNQKVVINNNNAGAGFTFKSASRFVGAF